MPGTSPCARAPRARSRRSRAASSAPRASACPGIIAHLADTRARHRARRTLRRPSSTSHLQASSAGPESTLCGVSRGSGARRRAPVGAGMRQPGESERDDDASDHSEHPAICEAWGARGRRLFRRRHRRGNRSLEHAATNDRPRRRAVDCPCRVRAASASTKRASQPIAGPFELRVDRGRGGDHCAERAHERADDFDGGATRPTPTDSRSNVFHGPSFRDRARPGVVCAARELAQRSFRSVSLPMSAERKRSISPRIFSLTIKRAATSGFSASARFVRGAGLVLRYDS